MNSRKSASDLVAIYRLEFYKKQKNWKLSAASKKEKERKKQPTTQKKKLDETYNIEIQDEKSDPLNVAFCEPDTELATDKTPQVCRLKHSLSQQWLEPVNIWPKNCKTLESSATNKLYESTPITEVESLNLEPKKAWIQKRLEVLLKAAEDNVCDVQSESGLGKLPKHEFSETLGSNKEQVLWDNDEEENWVPEEIPRQVWSEPWINTSELAQDWLNGQDIVDGLNIESRAVEDIDNVLSKIPWQTDSIEGEMTVDSVSEFIRGAHEAPHSSELDLALPSGLRAGDVSSETLCHLSSRQLKQAMSEYWQLLTRLLREQQTRKNLRSMSLYTDISHFEEFPTRDVGPSAPSPTLADDFVSGSHMIFQVGGRGRGRILQNRSGFGFGGEYLL